MVLDLIAQPESEQARREKTEHLLRQLLEARSGRSSERLSEDQLALFAAELKAQIPEAAEAAKDDDRDSDSTAKPGETPKGNPRGRRPIPGHLKRERIVHDLSEGEKHCKDCHEELRRIGEEVSERYEYIPAQMTIIEDVASSMPATARSEQRQNRRSRLKRARRVQTCWAQVIVSKYADHLPLNRQE